MFYIAKVCVIASENQIEWELTDQRREGRGGEEKRELMSRHRLVQLVKFFNAYSL